MSEDDVLDLRQQLVDLFNREEMLAFFDFALEVGSDRGVTGLCKISRPKARECSHYYSMLFIVDTADEEVRWEVGKYMKGINWEEIGSNIPGTDSVLSLQGIDLGPTVYFQEMDVYVKRGTDVTAQYITKEVYPTVSHAIGLKAGELMFWDDISEKDMRLESEGAAVVRSSPFPSKGILELLRRKSV